MCEWSSNTYITLMMKTIQSKAKQNKKQRQNTNKQTNKQLRKQTKTKKKPNKKQTNKNKKFHKFNSHIQLYGNSIHFMQNQLTLFKLTLLFLLT